MAWLKRDKAPLEKTVKKDTPEGLWKRCKSCNEIILSHDLLANQNVCPNCDYHYTLPPQGRIDSLLDEDSFVESNSSLYSTNPLDFHDSKPYSERLNASQAKTGNKDAIVTGRGTIFGMPVHLGVFDFGFLGGSMGSVVGEKISRLYQDAEASKEPAIIVSSSGGARMQEGIISLMQMAKTCAALARLRDAGVPFISILVHPTTGGVAASFSMLGDVNIGEPGALIGFAGPRVIQQTIKQELPEGFQTSEYLLDHGMLDLICHRKNMKEQIYPLLKIMSSKIEAPAEPKKK